MGKNSRLVFILIPIGIAINFIGGQIAILLRLPLYLDAIGTITVGALCGGIPGALVGLISNVINSVSSPITLWYGILNILFGLSAAYLSSKGVFKSLWKSLVSVLLFALIGGGIGSVMTWFLYGMDFGSGVSSIFSLPLHNIVGLPKFLSQFIAEFCMDVADKTLTILAVFTILKGMPKRFLSKLPLGGIYVGEDFEEE